MKRLLSQQFGRVSYRLRDEAGIGLLSCASFNPSILLGVHGGSVPQNSFSTKPKRVTSKTVSVVEEHDAAEKAKFSPSRNRESSSGQIGVKATQPGAVFSGGFMSDQGTKSSFNHGLKPSDAHVEIYDRTHTASLSAVMQSNVPQPYQVRGKMDPSLLNMSTVQWTKDDKYVSGEQHIHHNQTKTKKAPPRPMLGGTPLVE